MKRTKPTPIDHALDLFARHSTAPNGSPGDHARKNRNIAAARRRITALVTPPAHDLAESFDFGGKAHRCDGVTLGLAVLLDAIESDAKAEIMRVAIGMAIEAGRCEISGDAVEVEA